MGDDVIISAAKNVWIIIAINYDVPYDLSRCVVTRAELINAQILDEHRAENEIEICMYIHDPFFATTGYPFNDEQFLRTI